MLKIAHSIASIAISILVTAAGLYFEKQMMLLGGAALLFISVILGAVGHYRRKTMSDENDQMGDNNTIVGMVNIVRKMGSNNTIVGPTDNSGNTIFRGGTSIGAGAGFDPSSVIIGAGAGANIGKKK